MPLSDVIDRKSLVTGLVAGMIGAMGTGVVWLITELASARNESARDKQIQPLVIKATVEAESIAQAHERVRRYDQESRETSDRIKGIESQWNLRDAAIKERDKDPVSKDVAERIARALAEHPDFSKRLLDNSQKDLMTRLGKVESSLASVFPNTHKLSGIWRFGGDASARTVILELPNNALVLINESSGATLGLYDPDKRRLTAYGSPMFMANAGTVSPDGSTLTWDSKVIWTRAPQ